MLQHRWLQIPAALLITGQLIFLLTYLLQDAQIDLTQKRQATLDDETVAMLTRLPEKVHIDLFASKAIISHHPQINRQRQSVERLLRQMQRASSGLIQVHHIDPAPFSQDQELAAILAFPPVVDPVTGQNGYFGLRVRNTVDDQRLLPDLQAIRTDRFEYEIASLIHDVSLQQKPRLAVMSQLPALTAQTPEETDWPIIRQINRFYDVKQISRIRASTLDQVDALLLWQPPFLDHETRQRILDYHATGGSLLILADPFSEVSGFLNAGNRQIQVAFDDSLDSLLDHWDVHINRDQVLLDAGHARLLEHPNATQNGLVAYLPWSSWPADRITATDHLAAGLEDIHTASAGMIETGPDIPYQITSLIESSPDSSILPTSLLRLRPDPFSLLDTHEASGKTHALAVRLSPLPTSMRQASSQTQPGDIIIMAEADFLHELHWQGSQQSPQIADNVDLVLNYLDDLTATETLHTLRARDSLQRPLTRLVAIREEAQTQFRTAERKWSEQLLNTRDALVRHDIDQNTLSPTNDTSGIAQLRRELAHARQALRQIRLHATQDYDRAVFTHTLFVTLTGPVIMALLIGAMIYRRSRQRHSLIHEVIKG